MTAPNKQLPAIEGGVPVRKESLPFYRPSVDETDVELVTKTLRSGWLTLGPVTFDLERELARYLGAAHVIAVNSCSAAMFLALKALGVGPGDEVVTSAMTFTSTVTAIIHAGATPVLADIENETFGVAPDELVKRTTPKTRVFMPVHFGGQACRIDEVLDIAGGRGIGVVEDAAHSFGASFDGQKVGTFGDITAFSFYATKNLTTGEGGCLSTAYEELADKLRLLSYHGMSHGSWSRYADRGSWYYEVDVPGYKCNMSDMLSALGLSQLRRVDQLTAGRRDVAQWFAARLEDSPYFELSRVRSGNDHTWHLFVVRLRLDRLTIDRDQFIRALAAENIGCSVHFIPIYRHPYFRAYLDDSESYPVCEDYFSRCVSLPIFPSMQESDVDDVVSAMNRIAAYYSVS
ncbi:MAG: DegT/DnrJ/EryC1/StrS aminotransferase family protein [Candidatus Latescibacterota bacterium]|nr:MAG: DegT/DnrJ/EryC1/StrS aminotransferase family protein [Candidatus Latescibacterota bacterium]